jgi:hypothetical protein
MFIGQNVYGFTVQTMVQTILHVDQFAREAKYHHQRMLAREERTSLATGHIIPGTTCFGSILPRRHLAFGSQIT